MFNLGGVFLSLLVAILEFLWHARKNHANRQVSRDIRNFHYSVLSGDNFESPIFSRQLLLVVALDGRPAWRRVPRIH